MHPHETRRTKMAAGMFSRPSQLVPPDCRVLDKDLPSLHAAVAARNADFDCTLVNTESGEQAVPGTPQIFHLMILAIVSESKTKEKIAVLIFVIASGLDSQEMRLSGLAQLRQTPDLLEDLVTDSDSDLEGDLASARLQRRIVRQHSNVREPQKSGKIFVQMCLSAVQWCAKLAKA